MNPEKFFSPALTCSAPASEQPSPHPLPDLIRQQLAMVMETTCVFFRGAEALCKIQRQAAHHAGLRHESAMQKLIASCTPISLLEIQSELLRFDLEEATQYWQELAAVALQSQVELMTSASHLRDSPASQNMQSTLSTFRTALPLVNGFFPSRPRYAISE